MNNENKLTLENRDGVGKAEFLSFDGDGLRITLFRCDGIFYMSPKQVKEFMTWLEGIDENNPRRSSL